MGGGINTYKGTFVPNSSAQTTITGVPFRPKVIDIQDNTGGSSTSYVRRIIYDENFSTTKYLQINVRRANIYNVYDAGYYDVGSTQPDAIFSIQDDGFTVNKSTYSSGSTVDFVCYG